ncbi:hypothetical protein [Streptomyces prunicolor]|uniref:hypothetical protein n=1 Tax=Streptomyces prunicolor TaxID=67348 RepID=UPI0003A65EE2|nr:hypothetical protein [Streptomyces prunicolor]
MASRRTRAKRSERRFTIEGVRRAQPDIRKLSKALLAVVLAEQQREAEAAEERNTG